MFLRVSLSIASVIALSTVSFGQTTGDESVLDRSPLDNVRAGNVASRSPGNSIIRPALARHQGLMNDRLRGGDGEEESASGTGTGASTGSTSGSGSSSNDALSGLISSLTGGAVSGSSLDSLLSLLGNEGVSSILGGNIGSLLGTGTSSAGTTPAATATGSSTTGTTTANGATPTAEQQSSLELLLSLRDQYANGGTSKNRAKTIQGNDANAGRGTVAEGKSSARSQSTGEEEEDSFRVRLYDSWLGTLFAALSIAVTSRDFIDSIKDALRPVFGIPAPTPTTQPSQVRHIAPATERIATAVIIA